MFGLGFGEIIVILVVVLLVFGPEKLPEVARTLGRTMAEFRRTVDDIRGELTQPQLDIEREVIHRDTSAFRPLEGTCEEQAAASPPLSELSKESEPSKEEPKPEGASVSPAPEPAASDTAVDESTKNGG